MKLGIYNLFFAVVVLFGISKEAVGQSVQTDQADYAPGSTAIITGAGFTPNETVRLQVLNITDPTDIGSEHDAWTVTADTNGDFATTWYVTMDELGMTLQLTATGLTSGFVAQEIFTDGNASDGSGTATISPTAVNAGTTNTIVLTFATDSGKDYLVGSLATIVIPAGWTAPQTNSISSPGYCRVAGLGTGSGNITNISGTGPWTVYIDFAAQKNGNGFIFSYTNAVSPKTPGTNTFAIKTRNNVTSGGVITPLISGTTSSTITITVGPPTQLAFITSSQTLTAGVNSGTITIQIQDDGGNPTNATVARIIDLSTTSPGGVFKSMAGATISTITIAVGQNSTNFLYYDTNAASPTITAASTSPTTLTSATQVETVNAAAASKLVFTSSPVTVVAGVASSTITVQRQDPFNNPNTNDATITVNLTSSSPGGSFLNTGGTTAIASTNILNGSSIASFLYVDTKAGSPTITNTATGLTLATQTETVSKATPTVSGVTSSQSITYGTAAVTLGGTVSAAGSVYPTNGETVQVSINNITNNATVAGGVGGFSTSFSTATLPAGAYTITYAYAGGPNLNAAANNTSTTLTINKANSTVSQSGVSFSYNGARQTPAITISGSTGARTTNYVGTSVSYANVNAPTNAGTYYVSNTVAADSNFNGATNTLSFTISKAGLTLTPGTNVKTYDGNTSATNVPTAVGLQSSDTVSGTTVVYNTAAAGTGKTLSITAYTVNDNNGGNNYTVTVNTTTGGTINQAVTSIVLTSSARTNGYRDSVSFTATLPSFAVGNVQFKTNSVAFGGAVTLSGGSATSLTTTNLPRGTNTITAEFAGDSNVLGSTNSLFQVVTNHPPVAAEAFYIRTAGLRLRMFWSELATNWTDNVDNDTVTNIAINLTTTNGVVMTTNSLQILYPNTAANVNDRFSYTIRDSYGGTNLAYVNIVVNPFVTGQQITNSPSNPNSVTYFGIPGYTYLLQRSTNILNLNAWVNIRTNTIGDTGRTNVVDNFSDLGFTPSSAYYRVGWKPQY